MKTKIIKIHVIKFHKDLTNLSILNFRRCQNALWLQAVKIMIITLKFQQHTA